MSPRRALPPSLASLIFDTDSRLIDGEADQDVQIEGPTWAAIVAAAGREDPTPRAAAAAALDADQEEFDALRRFRRELAALFTLPAEETHLHTLLEEVLRLKTERREANVVRGSVVAPTSTHAEVLRLREELASSGESIASFGAEVIALRARLKKNDELVRAMDLDAVESTKELDELREFRQSAAVALYAPNATTEKLIELINEKTQRAADCNASRCEAENQLNDVLDVALSDVPDSVAGEEAVKLRRRFVAAAGTMLREVAVAVTNESAHGVHVEVKRDGPDRFSVWVSDGGRGTDFVPAGGDAAHRFEPIPPPLKPKRAKAVKAWCSVCNDDTPHNGDDECKRCAKANARRVGEQLGEIGKAVAQKARLFPPGLDGRLGETKTPPEQAIDAARGEA